MEKHIKQIDCTIIVLNYNTEEFTRRCLRSLLRINGEYSVEIIVVDNGSVDGSIKSIQDEFLNVTYILLDKNYGYAYANNVGLSVAKGRYTLFLNSDTQVYKNTIPEIIKYLDTHNKFTAATCKVVLENGSLDPACHRGFPTPWAALTYFLGLEKLFPKSRLFGQYHEQFLPMNETHQISVVSGAFLMIQTDMIKDLRGFDESYFFYGEDIDLCYRMKLRGLNIAYVPTVQVVHFKMKSGRSSNDYRKRIQAQTFFYQTMIIFYDKHMKKMYPSVINVLVKSILNLRIAFLKFFSI